MKLFATLLMASTFTIAVGCDSGSKGPATKVNKDGEPVSGSIVLNKPDKLDIKQGETKDVEISIDRKDYKGDVMLEFGKAMGLKVLTKDLTIKGDKSSAMIQVMAEEAAIVGDVVDGVKITAKPTTGDNVSVMMPVNIAKK